MSAPVIVVSPHLDDAALSCGGGIARLSGAGVPVTVVTVFTADQPPGAPLSALARRSHASWSVGNQPFAVRRTEDFAALRILGAEAKHLGLLDAMYRRSSWGDELYKDPLAPLTPHDVKYFLPLLIKTLSHAISAAVPETRIFCPAGTGGHVDHVLVRRAVEQLIEGEMIVRYDEYPYSARPGAAPTVVATADAWTTGVLPLSGKEIDTRIAAIGCYASQLRGLFPSEPERLREIASARLPMVGRWLALPPDLEASRERMATRVRQDTISRGGEGYQWASRLGPPLPEA